MDLDKFLEDNIIEFIDNKTDKTKKIDIASEEDYGIYIKKDYIKELTKHLENDELTRAKNLFNELNETYSKLPDNSTIKKTIYEILYQMSEFIKKYIQSKQGVQTPLPQTAENKKTIENKKQQLGKKQDTDQNIEELYQRAMYEFNKANQQQNILYKQGMYEFRMELYSKAIALFQQILTLKPNHAQSMIRLQMINEMTKKTQ